MSIAERYSKVRDEIPDHVEVVLAAKRRTPDEVLEAASAGATHIGHNYVQEAVAMHAALAERAPQLQWHQIGHIQRNKINKIVGFVDMVQTVDSVQAAQELSSRAERVGRTGLQVLIEVNSGDEGTKSGVAPRIEEVAAVAEEIVRSHVLQLRGIMTMAPFFDNPELGRPYYRTTRRIFEEIGGTYSAEPVNTLSMGMSDSYRVAIDEGSTMVRLGTVVFGTRGT